MTVHSAGEGGYVRGAAERTRVRVRGTTVLAIVRVLLAPRYG
jgi:hypothetical protein